MVSGGLSSADNENNNDDDNQLALFNECDTTMLLQANLWPYDSGSNWNVEMLAFNEEGKLENVGKNLRNMSYTLDLYILGTNFILPNFLCILIKKRQKKKQERRRRRRRRRRALYSLPPPPCNPVKQRKLRFI